MKKVFEYDFVFIFDKKIVLNKFSKSNIVYVPVDQDFKYATIARQTIQQRGGKPETREALKKLAKLVK